MSKEKGYLKDLDKSTKKHQEMCLWFTAKENAENFIRVFLADLPLELRTILEVPVKSRSGFLYGYADILMSYKTDQQREENVLIEVKSSLSDYGEVLRQIRTYQEYLDSITKTCLIHSGLYDYDETMIQYFVSQGIYIASLDEIKGEIKEHLSNRTVKVPAGKRSATLCGVYFITRRYNWSLDFLIGHYDTYLGYEVSDLLSSGNYFGHQEQFWEIIDKFGIAIDKTNPVSIFPDDEMSIPCSVDLSYRPGEFGDPEAVIERVYIDDEVIELIR